jgi:hypothetical protein
MSAKALQPISQRLVREGGRPNQRSVGVFPLMVAEPVTLVSSAAVAYEGVTSKAHCMGYAVEGAMEAFCAPILGGSMLGSELVVDAVFGAPVLHGFEKCRRRES